MKEFEINLYMQILEAITYLYGREKNGETKKKIDEIRKKLQEIIVESI